MPELIAQGGADMELGNDTSHKWLWLATRAWLR